MRHLKAGRKLNRTASHRKALFRNLAAALLHHESIKTTNPKAMELRGVADRLISLAKRNSADSTHAMRLAFAYLRDKDVVKKLFADIGARGRKGREEGREGQERAEGEETGKAGKERAEGNAREEEKESEAGGERIGGSWLCGEGLLMASPEGSAPCTVGVNPCSPVPG
jgi:ribosomal protein L17